MKMIFEKQFLLPKPLENGAAQQIDQAILLLYNIIIEN